METQTVEKTVESYIEAWNKEGIENIKAALEKCWIAGGSYTDPRYEQPLIGLDKLAKVLQDSQDKFPGRKIEIVSKIDSHHGSGRYIWRFSQPNGTTSEGLDYFEYEAENRITRLVSFFGKI